MSGHETGHEAPPSNAATAPPTPHSEPLGDSASTTAKTSHVGAATNPSTTHNLGISATATTTEPNTTAPNTQPATEPPMAAPTAHTNLTSRARDPRGVGRTPRGPHRSEERRAGTAAGLDE